MAADHVGVVGALSMRQGPVKSPSFSMRDFLASCGGDAFDRSEPGQKTATTALHAPGQLEDRQGLRHGAGRLAKVADQLILGHGCAAHQGKDRPLQPAIGAGCGAGDGAIMSLGGGRVCVLASSDWAQCGYHILGVAHKRGAIADQQVAANCARTHRMARHGHELAALIKRNPHGDQRA